MQRSLDADKRPYSKVRHVIRYAMETGDVTSRARI